MNARGQTLVWRQFPSLRDGGAERHCRVAWRGTCRSLRDRRAIVLRGRSPRSPGVFPPAASSWRLVVAGFHFSRPCGRGAISLWV